MGQLTAAQYETLFKRLGKHARAINTYLTLQGTTLAGDYSAIAGTYDLAEVAITAISKAASAVVTASGHPFAVGDSVGFFGVAGMTEINGETGTVTAADATTFTVDIASSGFTTYTSGGLATLVAAEVDVRRDLITSLLGAYQGFDSGVQGWINTLKGYCDNTLLDLQFNLNCPAASVTSILDLLLLDMADDTAPRSEAQTINASTITAPAVVKVVATGTGEIVASETYDGTIDDERAINEVVLARCISDVANGATAGNESFSLTGYPARSAADGANPRGSGSGPTITVAAAGSGQSLSTNGDFETWSASPLAPDDWTLDFGTAATHIVRSETSYTGDYACSLLSDDTIAQIKLSQDMSGTLVANTVYCLSFMLRRIATVDAGSTLTIGVTGTGVSASAYNASPSGLTTSYARYSVFFSCGASVPTDLELSINWTTVGDITAGQGVLIDELSLSVATNFGHTWYAAVRGDTDFEVDDRFRVTTANDYGGVFQTFFGRFYGALLPSNDAAGETISDNLAT